MVDLQSFIWVAFRESGETTAGLDTKALIELDQPSYEISPAPLLIKDSILESPGSFPVDKLETDQTRYWKIAPGENAKFWTEWRKDGL
jgi:hypothetical protein